MKVPMVYNQFDLAMRKIFNPEQYNYTILKKRITDTINKAKGIVEDKYIGVTVERGVCLDKVI